MDWLAIDGVVKDLSRPFERAISQNSQTVYDFPIFGQQP